MTSSGANCLIDAGALITGMSNEEVARALLACAGKRYRGCVFLDHLDRKMIVDRSGSPALPLGRSGFFSSFVCLFSFF